MFLLRLLAVLTIIAAGAGVLGYVVTRQPRYLQFSWRVFRYALVITFVIFALLVLERLALIIPL